MKKILACIIMSMLALVGCTTEKETVREVPNEIVSEDNNPIVTMEVKDMGTIKIELYPKVAPNTVNNFISLVNKGYYDGVTFHRISKGFVIQGGDPEGTGTGGPGYSIKGEFTNNKFENNLSHEPGVISMARTNKPDTAGSQFFIVTGKAKSLDGEYAAFGKVIEGMDIVNKIESVDTNGESPIQPVIMEKVTVDTKGINYPEPEKVK